MLVAAAQGQPPGPDLRERISATLATICPYRGLQAFREEDASFFCGRKAFADSLVGKVQRQSLVAVVGASGSGKSSVVRAGLVPRLRRGDTDRVWDVVTLVPGDRPLHALAAALAPLLEPQMTETDRLAEIGKLAGHLREQTVALRDVVSRALQKQPGTDTLLLVADQWEEIYTQCRDEAARRRFVDEVLDASASGPLSVVLTMRGDFYGHAVSDRRLADRMQDAVVNLGPMTRKELEQAIVEPARQVNLTFEPGLVEKILDDVGDEPGNLPLLEFVLTRLWEQRRGGLLHHDAYNAMDGLQGAIARHADDVLREELTEQERETARRIFVQLVHPGDGTADTRRRTGFSSLGEDARSVVETLASGRLLVTGRDEATGEETVEVAHEALIRKWETLREWMKADRAFRLWQERLRDRLREWEASRRDRGGLLQGALLTEAEEWLAIRRTDLPPAERDFIEASLKRKRPVGARVQAA